MEARRTLISVRIQFATLVNFINKEFFFVNRVISFLEFLLDLFAVLSTHIYILLNSTVCTARTGLVVIFSVTSLCISLRLASFNPARTSVWIYSFCLVSRSFLTTLVYVCVGSFSIVSWRIRLRTLLLHLISMSIVFILKFC